jgi:hypothetical protein
MSSKTLEARGYVNIDPNEKLLLANESLILKGASGTYQESSINHFNSIN